MAILISSDPASGPRYVADDALQTGTRLSEDDWNTLLEAGYATVTLSADLVSSLKTR